MVQGIDVRLAVWSGAEIDEEVGLGQQDHSEEAMVGPQEVPHGGQEQGSASGDEAEEEYDDQRVLVVHEVMGQAGAAIGDATIGERKVESAQRRGDVADEQPVEKADGRIAEGREASEEGHKGEEADGEGEDEDIASERHCVDQVVPR